MHSCSTALIFNAVLPTLPLSRPKEGIPPPILGQGCLIHRCSVSLFKKELSVALPITLPTPFQVTLPGTRRRKTTGSVHAGASCSWRVCVDGREPATIYRRQPDLSVLQKCITLLATPAPNMCSTWRSYGLVMSLPWRRDAKAQGSALLRGLGTSTPGRQIE